MWWSSKSNDARIEQIATELEHICRILNGDPEQQFVGLADSMLRTADGLVKMAEALAVMAASLDANVKVTAALSEQVQLLRFSQEQLRGGVDRLTDAASENSYTVPGQYAGAIEGYVR